MVLNNSNGKYAPQMPVLLSSRRLTRAVLYTPDSYEACREFYFCVKILAK